MKKANVKSNRTAGAPAILSIGYEKLETKAFLGTLVKHKIGAVIDVRESAFSRRLDFRKNRLVSLLDEQGIKYFHMRNAGNPHRKMIDDIELCLQLYREHLLTDATLIKDIADELIRIGSEYSRLAILCYEKCPSECHRTILIDTLMANDFDCSLLEA